MKGHGRSGKLWAIIEIGSAGWEAFDTCGAEQIFVESMIEDIACYSQL